VLVLCSPNNPTGSVYSAEQYKARFVLLAKSLWLGQLPFRGFWLMVPA
jgi:aspartate/methionine/tyrosine aminotransferase